MFISAKKHSKTVLFFQFILMGLIGYIAFDLDLFTHNFDIGAYILKETEHPNNPPLPPWDHWAIRECREAAGPAGMWLSVILSNT